jgi:predicted lactoylglutathione lyase
MPDAPLIVSLPIADRPTSFAFYQEALGLVPIGEPADDGVPEPLQFVVNDGIHLMLVPTGGFGWVIGDREVAPAGTSECVFSLAAATNAEVEDLVARATRAGATVITEPGPQPWGYVGTFADPDGHLWMVTATAPGTS